MNSAWGSKVGRFFLLFALLAGAAGALGYPFLSPEGRRGLLLAAAVAFAVEFLSVAVLASLSVGTMRYLLARVLMGTTRFLAAALLATVLAGREEVNLRVAMLSLVVFICALLLAEPWMLRDPAGSATNE